jgi:hypothetical protein
MQGGLMQGDMDPATRRVNERPEIIRNLDNFDSLADEGRGLLHDVRENRDHRDHRDHDQRHDHRDHDSSRSGHSSVLSRDDAAHQYENLSSFGQTLFNSCNMLMGVGLLSLPYAMRLAGECMYTRCHVTKEGMCQVTEEGESSKTMRQGVPTKPVKTPKKPFVRPYRRACVLSDNGGHDAYPMHAYPVDADPFAGICNATRRLVRFACPLVLFDAHVLHGQALGQDFGARAVKEAARWRRRLHHLRLPRHGRAGLWRVWEDLDLSHLRS